MTDLEVLLEDSKVLTNIYFGQGIPIKEGGISSGNHTEADMDALAAYGFDSIASIKEKTKEVFSSSMCKWLYERAFTGFKTDTTMQRARYYEDKDGRIMVKTDAEVYQNGAITYDLTTAKIVKRHKKQVTLTMQATVVTPGGLSRSDEIEVVAVKTADGWRLDSPTYFVYYSEEN